MPRLRLLLLFALAGALLVPAARAAQLQRLVPQPDGRANFGFTFRLYDSSDLAWGDTRPFQERISDSVQHELGGKTPTFLTVWSPWQEPEQPGKPLVPFSAALPDIAKVRSVVGDQGLIHLEWTLSLSSQGNGGLTVKDIRDGAVDAYIRAYARDVRNYGKPLLITPLVAEFNGTWWWAVSPGSNPGLTTDDFVQAWRRVVDIFRAVGANNVSWAWVVNSYPQPSDEPVIAYWPGDDYVDWVGADIYDVSPPHWLDGPYSLLDRRVRDPARVQRLDDDAAAELARLDVRLLREPYRRQGDLVLQLLLPAGRRPREVGSDAHRLYRQRPGQLRAERERSRQPAARRRAGHAGAVRPAHLVSAVRVGDLDRAGGLQR